MDASPGVAVPVIAGGPTTDMDVGTADGLLPGIAGFYPTSAWGGGDGVRQRYLVVPALIQPRLIRPAWGDGDDATAAISAWGDGDETTTAMPDGAGFDPTSLDSAWGDGDGATTGVKRRRSAKT